MRSFVLAALLLSACVVAIDLSPYDGGDISHVGGQNANDAYYSSYANLGTGSPSQVFYSSVSDGDYNVAENWAGGFVPRTIDNVFIEVDDQVVVTLSATQIARTLTVSLGNDFVIADGATLVLAPNFFPCEEGDAVDPVTLTCLDCTGLGVQDSADQASCNNCGDTLQIPNAARTACEFCPVGTVFNTTCTDLTCDETTVCLPCAPFTSSDGLGGQCECCPAGSSSAGGDACATCPIGLDSIECGECLPCVPSIRDLSCPSTAGNNCSGQGSCIDNFVDVFGVSRSVCQCNTGFIGQACQLDPTDTTCSILPITSGSAASVTLPFPYDSFNFASRSIAVGPTLSFPAGMVTADIGVSACNVGLETDFAAEGYVDPTVVLPADCPQCVAQIFGFDLNAWVMGDNSAVQQNLTVPFQVSVPYDNLREVVNPNAIRVYYWNVAELEWINVQNTCTNFTGNLQLIDNDSGAIIINGFELSAQYQVFVDESANNWGTPTGTGDNDVGTPSFYGNARPPTATTGITGLQPVAAPTDPGQATVSPGQRLQSSSAPALSVSCLALLLVIFALL